MRKIVRKDNSRRKKILSMCLVLFLFMGIGYSVISSNLLFNGNIELSKYESPYLYDVLKNEALSGGLAKKYTGEHHDSFTEEPSKDIYHWYAASNAEGTEVQNKNNVIFADHCWQMIRTTDTGGVKMIYNGEAENGQCLDTRGNHVGYYSSSPYSLLYTPYVFGSDYSYDENNNTFSLSGDSISLKYGDSFASEDIIGKYTCKKSSFTDTCSTLYFITNYDGYFFDAVSIVKNSLITYSIIAYTFYNTDSNSFTKYGYMHSDKYNLGNIDIFKTISFRNSVYVSGLYSASIDYWYADDISYNSSTRKYSLVNPYKISSSDEYSSLAGKYTFRNTSDTYTNSSVDYLIGVKDSYLYTKTISSGKTLSAYEPIIIGDSISYNNDDTYTLNNTISVSLTEWFNNCNNYVNKYVCGDNSNTCAAPRYITETSSLYEYSYIDASKKILIAKSRNDNNLIDTVLIRIDELIKNYANYSDYKYTCGDTTSVCDDDNLSLIESVTDVGYKSVKNIYYGSGVTWDGTNYSLVNPIGLEHYSDLDSYPQNHYICTEYGEKTCSTVGYIFDVSSNQYYYITLNDGVTSYVDMFKDNTVNSSVKMIVDDWYRHHMLDYDNYIEDTIFCNDRTIVDYGDFNPNGVRFNNSPLIFNNYNEYKNLACSETTDKFSISNPQAQLTYKVALMTSPELLLLNNSNARKSSDSSYLLSPYDYDLRRSNAFCMKVLQAGGSLSYGTTNAANGLRPAISLKPGTEFIYGTGTKEDPYVVKTKKECTYNGELTQGAEFVDGQYTYRYMQERRYDPSISDQNWLNITDDGWGVTVTDKESTNPVNTKLCTSINNKPIVSMSNMFLGSQASSIDLSSFDTSNVINMGGMFSSSQTTSLDLRGFDTRKVTDMSEMFSNSEATSLDLRSFDTSKVVNMNGMFWSNHASSLDLSSFNTKNVTDMSYMFIESQASTLDLTNFNTKNVTNMNFMFSSCASTSIDVSSFNTSKVTNMGNMFRSSKATSLDLSNFDNRHNPMVDGMLCDYNTDNVTFGNNFSYKEEMSACNDTN